MKQLPINSPYRAVEIAHHLTGTGIYWLGTGNWNTPEGGKSDCAGFAINKCYNIVRHRPGFNRGAWASVSDDINCNSAIEDSEHTQELFEPLTRPEVGALLAYPTIRKDGKQFIGHVAIVVAVPAEWEQGVSRYEELTVVQCAGPNGRTPAIRMTDASHWDSHDRMWPKPAHRSKLIRVKQ